MKMNSGVTQRCSSHEKEEDQLSSCSAGSMKGLFKHKGHIVGRFSSGRESLTGTDVNLSSRLSKRQSSVLLSLDVVQTSRQKLVMCPRINGKHGSNVPSLNVALRDVGRNGTLMMSGKVSNFSVWLWRWEVIRTLMWYKGGGADTHYAPPPPP